MRLCGWMGRVAVAGFLLEFFLQPFQTVGPELNRLQRALTSVVCHGSHVQIILPRRVEGIVQR